MGGYGSMLGQVFKRDYPDYSVGAQLNISIRNRIAKADAARDELQYRQSEVRVQQLHSQVRLQVGNAFIAVQQARESYKAAVEARTLQEQALDVEHAKFEAGVATAYEFLQFQSSLTEAKSAEVTALGVYAKAKTALQRAVGSTLADNNVTVDDAYSNRSVQAQTPAQPKKKHPWNISELRTGNSSRSVTTPHIRAQNNGCQLSLHIGWCMRFRVCWPILTGSANGSACILFMIPAWGSLFIPLSKIKKCLSFGKTGERQTV